MRHRKLCIPAVGMGILACPLALANPSALLPLPGIETLPLALLQILLMMILTQISGGYKILRAQRRFRRRIPIYVLLLLLSCWLPLICSPIMLLLMFERGMQFRAWASQAPPSTSATPGSEGIPPRRLRICAAVMMLSLPVFLGLWLALFSFVGQQDPMTQLLREEKEKHKSSAEHSEKAAKDSRNTPDTERTAPTAAQPLPVPSMPNAGQSVSTDAVPNTQQAASTPNLVAPKWFMLGAHGELAFPPMGPKNNRIPPPNALFTRTEGDALLLEHGGPKWHGIYATIDKTGRLERRESSMIEPGASQSVEQWPYMESYGPAVPEPGGIIALPSPAQSQQQPPPEGYITWLLPLADGGFCTTDGKLPIRPYAVSCLRRGKELVFEDSRPDRPGETLMRVTPEMKIRSYLQHSRLPKKHPCGM